MARILVVDDDDGVRKTLYDFLVKLGYEVLSASGGEEALEKMKESPDIVLLDIMMPELNGMKVLDRIKEISPSTEVIMITGLAEHSVGIKSRERGAFEFVTKPIDLAHLKFVLDFKISEMELAEEQ